jgi:outer membrane receptor protein involved in Fe transport
MKCFRPVLALAGIAGAAWAQTATGTIQGTVRDNSGAVIVGAKISLTDQGTNQSRQQVSGSEGAFEFRALPRGVYKLEAEQSGFKKEVISDIALQVAQSHQVDVTLAVGAVTEAIEVVASTGLLQVAEPTLSQVIDEKRVLDLPLNGRNFMALTHLSAGVITSGRAGATQRQANYGAGFSVGGQRDTSNVVLLDGLEISGQEIMNYPLAVPSLESVAEFRVQTSNYTAEFGGNSGAIINVASRRGSNRFHGDFFEFLRNDALDARNFFSARAVPLKRNQFGFTVSGPVWLPKLYNGKDRTFFLYNHEWTRQRNAISSTALVPNASERAGNFSFVQQAGFAVVDPLSKTPFPNNTIPASRINRIGQAMVNFYPAPNSADPARNYFGNPSRKIDNSIPTGRLDHQLSSKDSLFGRVTLNMPQDRSPGQALTQSFPGFDSIQDDVNIQSSIGWTRIFSSGIVNEALVGYVRFRRDRVTQDSGRRNWVQELGIRGYAPDPLAWGAPAVQPSGYPEVGYSSNNAVLQWITQSEQVSDNLSIVRNKHTLKTGFSLQSKRNSQYQLSNATGTFGFSGMFTAPPPVTATTRFNSIADLLTGYPTSFSVTTLARTPHLLQKLWGVYFQDDWRVSPNLTLNLGVRWEYFGRPVDRYDRIASLDLATGRQLLPGRDGVPRSLADQDYNNWSPRIGFAWRVRGSNRLSLRGGYGIYYSPSFGLSWRQHAFQEPFGLSFTRTVRPPDPRNPLPVFSVDNPLADLTQQVFLDRWGVERKFRDGYVGQWNLTVQHLLTRDTLLEVAYHGSKSTRIPSRLNYNQIDPFPAQPPAFQQNFPYPTFSSVNILESRAASNYHALQSRLERRLVNGFTLLAAYTWQKTLADLDAVDGGFANGAGPFGPQTIKNLRANKGPSVFDRPHRLALSSLYELPILRGKSGLAASLVGGWQIGALALFESGAYLTPGVFGVSFTGSRANLLGNPNLSRGERSIDRWFDVSKLANPAPGQLGNAGKGTIQGSGHNKWDLIVQKNFKLAEGHRVEFRTEFFNAFNHPQFDDPALFPATHPQAGRISSASDFGFTQTERVIQFGLKYHF